jgi:hypothetical protein
MGSRCRQRRFWHCSDLRENVGDGETEAAGDTQQTGVGVNYIVSGVVQD